MTHKNILFYKSSSLLKLPTSRIKINIHVNGVNHILTFISEYCYNRNKIVVEQK